MSKVLELEIFPSLSLWHCPSHFRHCKQSRKQHLLTEPVDVQMPVLKDEKLTKIHLKYLNSVRLVIVNS